MINRNIKFLKQKTVRIAKQLERFIGAPRLPKQRAKPLDMLIATVLSQNTNDRNSHRAYLQLRRKYPTWSAVLAASSKGIASAIRVGGMANQKSKMIKSILEDITRRFGKGDLSFLKGKTDEGIFDLLVSFDGVGSKTAACVLLFSLGRDFFPVDTHVHRICIRLGLVEETSDPEKTFESMKKLVPKGKAYSLHVNLIQFGRKICRSNQPLCRICPLFDECRFKEKSVYRKLIPRSLASRDYRFMLLEQVA